MPRAKPTKPTTGYTPAMCARVEAFADERIAADAHPPSVVEMAVHLGISRPTLYRWKEEKPEFCEAIDRAQNKCQAYFERKAWEIATGRIDAKPAMMIYLMKCRFPADYADRHEVTGANGAAFVLKLDASDLAL